MQVIVHNSLVLAYQCTAILAVDGALVLMLKRLFPAIFACVLAAPLVAQAPLRVAAAADLEPVLPPILEQFQQATSIHAEATYQASAMLTTEIENGAPFDLFFSADLSYPKRLIDAGLADAAGSADSSTPITYARGTLVLWTRKDSHLPPPSLDLLRSPAMKRLAIANPDRAPYGRAAVAALQSLGLYDSLKPRIVTAENIAQAAQFVDSANADAGLISLTSALTPRLSADGAYFVIPRTLYPPIEQGAVIISSTKQRAAVHKLLDFLLSPAVQAQLAKSGLTPVEKK
jgi:molybdate transport system substrate-binding protein